MRRENAAARLADPGGHNSRRMFAMPRFLPPICRRVLPSFAGFAFGSCSVGVPGISRPGTSACALPPRNCRRET
eukprot:1582473-Rhodomonas_salina.1